MGAIATYDTTTQVADVAAPTYQDWTLGRDQVKTSLSWVGRRASHQGRLRIHPRDESHPVLVDLGHAGEFRQRRSGLSQHLARANDDTSQRHADATRRSLVVRYLDNIHGAYIQDKWSPLSRLVLNLGCGSRRFRVGRTRVNGNPMRSTRAPAIRASRAVLQEFLAAIQSRLRHQRQRQDGHQVLRQSLQPAAQPVAARSAESANRLHGDPGHDRLAISDTRQWLSQAQCNNAGRPRLRSQRRSHPSASRSLDRHPATPTRPCWPDTRTVSSVPWHTST